MAPFRWLCAAALIAALSPVALAQELPTFRFGMWEFVSTLDNGPGSKPQVITVSRCTDPTEEMKRQNDKLAQVGCSISPPARSGKVYSFSSSCSIHGKATEFKSALTAESDSAYSLRTESRQGAETAVESMKARRTGDCAK